jgi:hypothetical protein
VRNSVARIKLAGRFLKQMRSGGGQPITLSEVGQLRFLAESDEEMELRLDQLALTVIERESKRMGIRFPAHDIPFTGRN